MPKEANRVSRVRDAPDPSDPRRQRTYYWGFRPARKSRIGGVGGALMIGCGMQPPSRPVTPPSICASSSAETGASSFVGFVGFMDFSGNGVSDDVEGCLRLPASRLREASSRGELATLSRQQNTRH